jgi:hypothetical protein
MTTTKTKKAKPRASKQTADEKYLGLTEQEFNRFRQACRTTLNYIAHFVMSAGLEVKGKMMRREHAIEVVFDADNLFTYGAFNTAETPKMRKDWVRFYDERIQPMMKKVFPDQIWFDKGDINYVQSHDNKGSRLPVRREGTTLSPR